MKHYFVVILLLSSFFCNAQETFLFCEKQVNQILYSQITIPEAKVFFNSIPKVKEGHFESKPLGGIPGSYTDWYNVAYKKEGVNFRFMKGNTPGYASEEYVLRMVTINKKSPNVLSCDSLHIGDVVTLAGLGLTANDYVRDITMKAKYGDFTKNGVRYSVVITTKGKLTTDSHLRIKQIILDFR
jgi:hypothetical protein